MDIGFSRLTWQEWIILIAVISFIASLILSVIRCSIKLMIGCAIVMVMFSVFTWIPEQINIWLNNGNTDAIVQQGQNKVDEWIETDGQTWIQAGKSLWCKIVHCDKQ